ncbi:MAG: hypothetical protein NTV86_00075 [Planctomycetota bacterium]|nr:hypothetical protein [Planctomycetota bacterium]
MTKPLNQLAKDILADGVVDASEVRKMKERLYADGVIDREEADFLFKINDGVSGMKNARGWKKLFVDAITSHVLDDPQSPGEVDAAETRYLLKKISADGKVDDVELALLVNIVTKAKATSSAFQRFVLAALKAAILEDGVIDAAEVKMLRSVVYGSGSGGGAGVDRPEADFLFELNDAVSGRRNHPSWKRFFVEAITKHVLEDEDSPGEVDTKEGAWLLQNIQGDGTVDDVELALLRNLKAKAKTLPAALKAKMAQWKI